MEKMPHRLILLSETVSTFFSVALAVTFWNMLSAIASVLAIAWWLIKFYEKYGTRIKIWFRKTYKNF